MNKLYKSATQEKLNSCYMAWLQNNIIYGLVVENMGASARRITALPGLF